MPLNGTELIDSPWDTIWSPFTDLMGNGFFLVPLTFICIALYIKTRDTVLVSAFMLGAGSLLAGGSLFADFPEMGLVYLVFAALGVVGLIVGIFFIKER